MLRPLPHHRHPDRRRATFIASDAHEAPPCTTTPYVAHGEGGDHEEQDGDDGVTSFVIRGVDLQPEQVRSRYGDSFTVIVQSRDYKHRRLNGECHPESQDGQIQAPDPQSRKTGDSAGDCTRPYCQDQDSQKWKLPRNGGVSTSERREPGDRKWQKSDLSLVACYDHKIDSPIRPVMTLALTARAQSVLLQNKLPTIKATTATAT